MPVYRTRHTKSIRKAIARLVMTLGALRALMPCASPEPDRRAPARSWTGGRLRIRSLMGFTSTAGVIAGHSDYLSGSAYVARSRTREGCWNATTVVSIDRSHAGGRADANGRNEWIPGDSGSRRAFQRHGHESDT